MPPASQSRRTDLDSRVAKPKDPCVLASLSLFFVSLVPGRLRLAPSRAPLVLVSCPAHSRYRARLVISRIRTLTECGDVAPIVSLSRSQGAPPFARAEPLALTFPSCVPEPFRNDDTLTPSRALGSSECNRWFYFNISPSFELTDRLHVYHIRAPRDMFALCYTGM